MIETIPGQEMAGCDQADAGKNRNPSSMSIAFQQGSKGESKASLLEWSS
jgi:hypothetical protein